MESYGSFPEEKNRDDAIDTWYSDLRADMLTEDELNFELDILVDRDRSRMRGCLRSKLKSEQEAGQIPPDRNLKNTVKQEIAIARQKLEEIETQIKKGSAEQIAYMRSRLLHLGARLRLALCSATEMEKDDLTTIFSIVMNHLYYFYYREDAPGNETESGTESEDEELTLEQIIQQAGAAETLQVDKAVLLRELEKLRQANEEENRLKTELQVLHNEISAGRQQSNLGDHGVQTDDLNLLFQQWQISSAGLTIPNCTPTTTSSFSPSPFPKSVSFNVPTTYGLGTSYSGGFSSYPSYTLLNNPIPSPYPQLVTKIHPYPYTSNQIHLLEILNSFTDHHQIFHHTLRIKISIIRTINKPNHFPCPYHYLHHRQSNSLNQQIPNPLANHVLNNNPNNISEIKFHKQAISKHYLCQSGTSKSMLVTTKD